MSDAIFKVPSPLNEPVLSYAPGTKERKELKQAIEEARNQEVEIPMTIGGKDVFSNNKVRIHPPHDIGHTLGYYHKGDAHHVNSAIAAALKAKPEWEAMPWQSRAAIFLKAADLLAGPFRAKMNAATMLGQSKNAYQSEIDAVCEFADFLRFNVHYMTQMFTEQPFSPAGTWNRLEFRPLEGFVFALTPFNFTSIAGNLCVAPALFGNVVVWKPSETQIYSAKVIMDLFKEAGLPDGVINLVFVPGKTAGEVIFEHTEFAGLHFTGGTGTFQNLWRTIGNNIHKYKSYPRIVGETGGKDFVIAHPSSDKKAVAVGLVRGAFEYQGQKCSAASRAYIPASIWPEVKEFMQQDLNAIKMGGPEHFNNFINAVIDEKSFDSLQAYIEEAKESADCEIIAGGNCDKSKGYFIEPTVILTTNPKYRTMCEELFGPVLTIYVYEDSKWSETLQLLDQTSPYALTGAVFSQDRAAIEEATTVLRHAAGNFYINDKPTGAVVGQQPFGGARASGTNDKAGSVLNLWRWVSVRTIKENFVPPTEYSYPFLSEE
jgi:1-pyrroline-5-carboxylate dehydrogenase